MHCDGRSTYGGVLESESKVLLRQVQLPHVGALVVDLEGPDLALGVQEDVATHGISADALHVAVHLAL